MQNKYRFIGIRPFETSEKDLFFEREKYTEEIFKSIYFNKITVVHSDAGVGKTSIIKAGLLPKLDSKKKFISFYFSIPNYIKDSNISPTKILNNTIDKSLPKYSYLDKVIKPDESLWYKLKRLESTEDIEILIILDQFENIFSFSQTEIAKFKEEIVKALFEQIPQENREKINLSINKNPNLLTKKGFEKLYKTVNLKLLFVTRSDKLFKLNFFKDKINTIDKNLIEIEQLNKQQAKNIFLSTTAFETKYNIDNNLISKPFSISEKLIDEIINFLSKKDSNHIETYQLQIIGREIEMISIKKRINFIDFSEVTDFDALYNDYYEGVVNKIENSTQRISARKFIEDELIFEYEHRKLTIFENIAKFKYNLSEETIDILISNNLISLIKNDKEEIFYEISHDALITPILMAKDKRVKYEIQIEKELLQKKIFEQKAKFEAKKASRNKKISFVFINLFLISLILTFLTINQRNIAVKNEKLANSSLYASIAFKILKIDPTISFRYAQKSFNIDENNPLATSAILHSFYESNIFYSKNINTAIKADDAVISTDCSKIILISNSNKNNLYLTIINSNGEILSIIPQSFIMSSVNFSSDAKFIIVSYYNHETTIFDIKGNIINTIKANIGYTLFANFSHDNSKIVTCGSNNTAQIWSFEGELLTTLKGHEDEIKYADFSPDGSLIVTIGQDAKVIVYNLKGKIIAQYRYLLEYEFQSNDFQPVKFFPEGDKILFVVNDNIHFNYQIIIWDYKKNKIIAQLKKFNAFINNVNFIDSHTIIASTKQNEAVLIDLNEISYRKLLGHTDWVFDAKLNPKESKIYTISKDQTIKSWKIYDLNKKFEHLKNKTLIKLSNQGVYFASFDGNLSVFNLTGDTLYFEKDIITSNIIFSENDELILTYKNKVFKIHNTKSGTVKKQILQDSIINISFVENDSRIKIICKNNIYISNLNCEIIEQQKLPFEVRTGDIGDKYISVANKEKCIIIKNNDTSAITKQFIYDIKNIKIADNNSDYAIFSIPKTIYLTKDRFSSYLEIKNDNPISSIEISKTGKLFCFGDSEGKCFVYNNQGKEIYKFELSGEILDLQFSPNERTIFVQYFDKYYNKIIKQFVIDPYEIINYIDDLKLYGEVFMPNKLTEYFLN